MTVRTGLTSWWSGDGITADSVGGQNATLQGGAGYAAGLVGQAFALNGTSAYVNVPDSPTVNVGSGDFTADLWANFQSTAGEQVLIQKYVETGTSATETGWSLTKYTNNALHLATRASASTRHRLVSPLERGSTSPCGARATRSPPSLTAAQWLREHFRAT